MPRPYVAAVSDYAVALAHNAGDSLVRTMPFHHENDVLVLVCNYYPSPDTPSSPAAPAGWSASSAATYAGQDRVLTGEAAAIWWWLRAVDGSTPSATIVRPDASSEPDSDTSLSAIVIVLRDCVTFGDPFESRSAHEGAESMSPLTSTHPEALAVQIATAAHYNVQITGPLADGYQAVASKYSFTASGAAAIVMTRPIEIESRLGISPSGIDALDPLGGFNDDFMLAFVAIPTAISEETVAMRTTVPIRGMERNDQRVQILGCPNEMQVFITGPDLEDRIAAPRWSHLEWSRDLDEQSAGKFRAPDEFGGVACLAEYNGLRPWRYGLIIERDGETIWKGPITKVSRYREEGGTGGIEAVAADCFVRFRKRLATRSESIVYRDIDAGQVFAELLNTHARVPQDLWPFPVPQVDSGTALTRDIVPRDFSYAWPIAEELLDSAIDAYVLAGTPVVFQPGAGWVFVGPLGEQYLLFGNYTAGGELVYGTFTNDAFTEIPPWTMDGMAQANSGVVVGADSGQAGFRKYWAAVAEDEWPLDSVLDIVETTALYRATEEGGEVDESTFQRRVDSLIALRGATPAVIEAVSLSQVAPIHVQHLRPGSIWNLDIFDAGYGQLLSAGRVKRVEGKADAANDGSIVETIDVTLYPLGYTEGDLS